MDVKVEKIDTNVVKLEIKVPAEVFEKGIDKAYRQNVGKFNIPGFRKGKAPKIIIEQMYGEGVFYEDAVNFVIDQTYPDAVKDNNIEPVDRPEIDVVDIGKGKDLVYTAKVTVKPDVELGEYKGIEVKAVEYPVTDKDIEDRLNQLRERNARIVVKEDGTIENGDIAVIDFEGFIDDKPFEGGKGENYQLEIGSGTFINGFEEQLIGKKAKDEVDVNVTFPEDYMAAELAGKPATFKVKINEIKYKELLPIDDEFAKDVSEFETLDELKADIQKKLKEANEDKAKREFENSVIKKAVENAKVEIPQVMVENEIDYIMEDINLRLMYQGMDLENYAKLMNTTVDKIREEYKDIALENVKTRLVLEKIGKVESIEANDEEVQEEINNMAKRYSKDSEKFIASIKDREKNIIKNDIILRKVRDFLVLNAKKTA